MSKSYTYLHTTDNVTTWVEAWKEIQDDGRKPFDGEAMFGWLCNYGMAVRDIEGAAWNRARVRLKRSAMLRGIGIGMMVASALIVVVPLVLGAGQ